MLSSRYYAVRTRTGVFWLKDSADFESKHPRDQDGRFASGAGTNVGTESFDREKFSQLLGNEITGVKGKTAVEALLKQRSGYVQGAFYRPEMGDVDLIWGDESVGLNHILKRRSENKGNEFAEKFALEISDVINNGEIYFNKERDTFEVWHNRAMCVVSKTYKGKDLRLVITAFPQRKKPPRFNGAA